jgi:Protein of unknown function (DUF3175)
MKIKLAAAARLVAAEKWSKEVTEHADHEAVPEGTFTKSADHIARTLKSGADSQAQAMERLNFYINRAGKNLSATDKKKLENAKDKLTKLYE